MKINKKLLAAIAVKYENIDEKTAWQLATMNFKELPKGTKKEYLELVSKATEAGHTLQSAVISSYGKLVIKYMIHQE